jgi:hypothetical protein
VRGSASRIPLESAGQLDSLPLIPAGQDQVGPQPSQLHSGGPADPGSRPRDHARLALHLNAHPKGSFPFHLLSSIFIIESKKEIQETFLATTNPCAE